LTVPLLNFSLSIEFFNMEFHKRKAIRPQLVTVVSTFSHKIKILNKDFKFIIL